jgi:NADH:ubiquinone oxidoreductase subunit F (NADH-binding)
LDKLSSGQGTSADIDKLEQLGEMMKKASLCGLGLAAPNPILSSLKYFGPEYDTLV